MKVTKLHKLIKKVEFPSITNIANILTIAEAAYRWEVTENAIKTRLRLKNSSDEKIQELRYLESIGYIKYFKPYEENNGKVARGTWLITTDVMKLWFGEPIHTETIRSI